VAHGLNGTQNNAHNKYSCFWVEVVVAPVVRWWFRWFFFGLGGLPWVNLFALFMGSQPRQ